MSSVSWTDSIGAATLSNGKPYPGARVANWTPKGTPHLEKEWALGTRRLHTFEFAEQNTVSFDIPAIPLTNMDLMLRLQKHLERGGLVNLNVMDLVGQTYTGCWLAPDSSVEIALTDKVCMEYTVSTRLASGDEFVDTEDSDTSSDEPDADLPGIAWDWDADLEVLNGRSDADLLETVRDWSLNGIEGLQSDDDFKIVLRTNQLNGHAIFDLTGNKFARTAAAFMNIDNDVTVFTVYARTGAHREHGIVTSFNPTGSVGAGTFLVKESASVAPGSLDDRIQFTPQYYIDQVDTDFFVLAFRFDNEVLTMWANGVQKPIINGVTGATLGMSVDYSPGLDVDVYHTLGAMDGVNGMNGKVAKDQGYGRALSDSEIVTRSNQLMTRFGL